MMIQECKLKTRPEVENEERAEPPGAPLTSTRRRIAEKSEPRAVTTQEAVDGYREKAMRNDSVEQTELGNIMELTIAGQVLRWTRQSNLSGGVALCKSGWMEYEESQPPDSRQAPALRRFIPLCWL